MFDAVRNNKRIVQIFLVLITLPFAFFGVDSYVKNAGSGGELASILRLAEGARHGKGADLKIDALSRQVDMVAGTRNRRCQYITVSV